MIPTTTLRERMREALSGAAKDYLASYVQIIDDEADRIGRSLTVDEIVNVVLGSLSLDETVDVAIEAIGDQVLIKTADSLEPTFTLRAQDKLAEDALDEWLTKAEDLGLDEAKIAGAETHLDAFRAWPTRKWPD